MSRADPPRLDDPNPLNHAAAADAMRMLEKAQLTLSTQFPARVIEYLERATALRHKIAVARGQHVSMGVLGYKLSTIQERDPEYIARRMVLIATMIQESEDGQRDGD